MTTFFMSKDWFINIRTRTVITLLLFWFEFLWISLYLMRGFQKYARNWILTMAFWATCKIAQPIQPIWQHIFALPWSALKKPPWEFNFFRIFGIPSSNRHEKCCQNLQTLFGVFQYFRKSHWTTPQICPKMHLNPKPQRS